MQIRSATTYGNLVSQRMRKSKKRRNMHKRKSGEKAEVKRNERKNEEMEKKDRTVALPCTGNQQSMRQVFKTSERRGSDVTAKLP